MQLLFDQTFVNTLATSVAPYSSEGTNPTTNASDRVNSTVVKVIDPPTKAEVEDAARLIVVDAVVDVDDEVV